MTVSAEPQAHSHLSQSPVIQALTQHMERARQQHLTGSLNFDTLHLPRMRLFFVVGRLVWAGGGLHRYRRWRRMLKQFCPNALEQAEALSPTQETLYWEYQVLGKLVDGGQMSREGARSLILANLTEVLFDIAQASKLIERFSRTETRFFDLEDAITFIPLHEFVLPLEAQWRTWCGAHLAQYSPNLAPAIAQADLLRRQVQPETFDKLTQLLRGDYSLRELSLIMQQDLGRLSQSMIAYEQQGLIELRVTPDIQTKSSMTVAPPLVVKVAPPPPAAAKIFCVDDSPTLCQQMGQVLTAAGYHYISTQDPVKALQMVIEEKPDFIFIDLVMPVVSGYELCSQIRRMEAFKDTPIVIFSSNALDNLRVKMAGADDTLSKPIAPKLLLETVAAWFKSEQPVRKSFRLARR
jgi:two-component system, chemotaxis family, response regulator PixG